MNRYIQIVFLVGIVLFILFIFFQNKNNTSPGSSPPSQSSEESKNTISQSEQSIEFNALDGYKLSGTFYPSKTKDQKSPAIILVHQFNSNRHDFDSFIPKLLQEDYSVLAYDIRGMGQSQGGSSDINDFPKDVVGAVNFLKTKSDVDPNKIAVIGASVGANVAYVASGSIPEIKAAVSLSPSNTGSRGVLLGLNIANFKPHNIFIASDEREKADADFIYSKSFEPKEQKVYLGFGHGKSLLNSEQATKDILDFLKKILAS